MRVHSGLTADANILISNARVSAQRHRYRFQEPIAVEQLIRWLCDTKQVYTQYGGEWVGGHVLAVGGVELVEGRRQR